MDVYFLGDLYRQQEVLTAGRFDPSFKIREFSQVQAIKDICGIHKDICPVGEALHLKYRRRSRHSPIDDPEARSRTIGKDIPVLPSSMWLNNDDAKGSVACREDVAHCGSVRICNIEARSSIR